MNKTLQQEKDFLLLIECKHSVNHVANFVN